MRFVRTATKEYLLQNRETALYFDLEAIGDNARFLHSLGNEGLRFLFPVKSFPERRVLSAVAPFLNGFDVSHENEVALIRDHLKVGDVVWNSAPYPSALSVTAVHDASTLSPGEGLRSLRVKLDQRGASRFGTAARLVTGEALEAAHLTALHFHHGVENITPEKFLEMIDELAGYFRDVPNLRQVNLGGGFGDLPREEVARIVTYAREKFPGKTLFFEPGRWLTRGAGLCIGKILDVCPGPEGLTLVSSISREAHLKWHGETLRPAFVTLNSRTEETVSAILGGPTCDEHDRLLTCRVNAQISRGDLVILEGVSGYAAAWNHSFNGIPPAEVVFLEKIP